MYTGYVQTPSNSHDECCSSCIGTLPVDIFRYVVGDKGKHLLEDIGSISVARSLRIGL
jgi:hypothetical protein